MWGGTKIVVKNIEKCFVGSEKGINFALAFGKKRLERQRQRSLKYLQQDESSTKENSE